MKKPQLNRKIQKVIAVITVITAITVIPLFPVLAQEDATPSATLAPSQVPTTEPTSTSEGTNPFLDSDSDFNIRELLDKAMNLFRRDRQESEQKINVQKLAKNTFKSTEKIPVIVEGEDADKIKIEVFSFDGEKVDLKIEKSEDSESVTLSIVPPTHFKPGRYRLKVTDSKGDVNTQDFTWGVLAINTNKSIYQPGDLAKLSMAVLDETGNMVCDAKVKLSIKDPQGKVLEHSTDENSIKVNPVCTEKVFTSEPDFEARYSVAEEGVYEMVLSAETKNGNFTINDSFTAKENVPFDVEREANTRIFPPLRYPVVFSITANEDFNGEVSEIVPESFDIGEIENMTPFDIETRPARANGTSSSVVLSPPFNGDYAMTQGFGEEETDPLLAEKYHKFGVVGHDGVDYALPKGTPVVAVDGGMVVRAQEHGDYGTTVVIQHVWGKSYYGHLSKMTKSEGDLIKKGEELGLSGNTGLSTGPHLHFGIKLSENDSANGYYGKINPLAYFAEPISDVAGVATSSAVLRKDAGDGIKILTWKLNIKKGENLKLGYSYLAPTQSPEFYTLGPLEFISDSTDDVIFKEARRWQIAVDADGSGTNTVNPTTGQPSTTGNSYVFTFTPTENMDSGQIQIQVPSSGSPDWSTPQGVAGTAGYTTAVGNVGGTVANVLNSNDALTGWTEDDVDFCNLAASNDLVLDTTAIKEGTGSIRCDNNPLSAGPDNNDSFGFDYGSNQNWATACNGGACTRVGYWIMRTNGASGTAAEFAWSSGTDLQATRIGGCAVPATSSSGVWVYAKCTLSGTLTTIRSYGFICTSNTCNPFETADLNIDELLIGPGVPTFSGRNINVRLLEASAISQVNVSYGAGGGSSGVTNSSTEAVHTFTTLSKTSVSGTLTNISSHPTITIIAGPTNDQLMRHGNWFLNGAEQPFSF